MISIGGLLFRVPFRRHAGKLVMIGMVGACYLVAVPNATSIDVLIALASPLEFKADYIVPANNGRPMRTVRRVHPQVKRIDAWISSVGAAVALADIEGIGRPADI